MQTNAKLFKITPSEWQTFNWSVKVGIKAGIRSRRPAAVSRRVPLVFSPRRVFQKQQETVLRVLEVPVQRACRRDPAGSAWSLESGQWQHQRFPVPAGPEFGREV
jgi:hypothetical protein